MDAFIPFCFIMAITMHLIYIKLKATGYIYPAVMSQSDAGNIRLAHVPFISRTLTFMINFVARKADTSLEIKMSYWKGNSYSWHYTPAVRSSLEIGFRRGFSQRDISSV